MTIVRLAHVSDVHLGPLPGFGLIEWRLKRAVGFVNWHRKRSRIHRPEALASVVADIHGCDVDHICLTGDLVNIGLPAEYAAAARWLATLGDPDRVSVVPGNHDVYVKLADGAGAGIGAWRPYMASSEPAARDAPAFPFIRRIGPVAIIGLNSAVVTPVGFASGRLGERQRAALETALGSLHAERQVTVVMIHHPPLPGLTPPRRALDDAPELARLIERQPPALVLYGHNHRTQTSWHATTRIEGVGSASAAAAHGREGLASWNLVTIRAEPGTKPVIEVENRCPLADAPARSNASASAV